MSGRIYVFGEGNTLHPLEESGYEAEAVLQELLANYPDLLAGEQVNPSDPRRWLLISREIAVASDEGGRGRWALDHLFIDQEGIPTLVEVKRSTNSQIRREVVGQMLDYAANGSVYWSIDKMVASYSGGARSPASTPIQNWRGFSEVRKTQKSSGRGSRRTCERAE